MNYFSFQEILFGISAFFICGFIATFLTESLRLVLLSKNVLWRFLQHLYCCRFFLLKQRERFSFRSSVKEGKIEKNVVDFVLVLLLFLEFILSSFVFFDGIFRAVYLLPMLLSCFFAYRYLVSWYRRAFLFLIRNMFALLSAVLAVPIFLLSYTIRALTHPFLYILYITRRAVLCNASPMRKKRLLYRLRLESEQMLEQLNISI